MDTISPRGRRSDQLSPERTIFWGRSTGKRGQGTGQRNKAEVTLSAIDLVDDLVRNNQRSKGKIDMNIGRIGLATLAAFVTYFILGGAIFGALPWLREEFHKYPAVFRNQQGQLSHMPVGMAAMLLAMLVLAVLYAMTYRGSIGLSDGALLGARFGALVGAFAIGSFVLHNYVNLNIGLKLTMESAIAALVLWTFTGIAIGLVYRPSGTY